MIEQKLRAIVPDEVNEFNKLTKGDPYYFSHWGNDRNGTVCIYYWFYSKDKAKKNQKRVFIDEIEKLLKTANKNKVEMINRNMFYKLCPKSYSDGSGYAVTIRLLEALKMVKYAGSAGARVTNKEV